MWLRLAPPGPGLASSLYRVSAGSVDANNLTMVRLRAMHLGQYAMTIDSFLGLIVKPQRGQFKQVGAVRLEPGALV